MDRITLIGMIAAACTTIAFFPQAYKVYKTKHTQDLSLPMYVIFAIGILLWLIYGIMINNHKLYRRGYPMKAIFSIILALTFALSAGFIYAQEVYNRSSMHLADSYKPYSGAREKIADSPGMESIKVGSTTVFIPEGMKVYETGGQVLLEDDDAYMGRRFRETEEHLKAIDETLKDLKKEIEGLKKK